MALCFVPGLERHYDRISKGKQPVFSFVECGLSVTGFLGGIAAGLVGLSGIVLLDSASYLIAGGLILFILVQIEKKENTSSNVASQTFIKWVSVWKEWFESLLIVRRKQLLLLLFILIAIVSFGEGVFGGLFIPFVNKVLHGEVLS